MNPVNHIDGWGALRALCRMWLCALTRHRLMKCIDCVTNKEEKP